MQCELFKGRINKTNSELFADLTLTKKQFKFRTKLKLTQLNIMEYYKTKIKQNIFVK